MSTISVIQHRPANELPAYADTCKQPGHPLPITEVSNRAPTAPLDTQAVLDETLLAVMSGVTLHAPRVEQLSTMFHTSERPHTLDQQALRQLRKAIRKDKHALTPTLQRVLGTRATRLLNRHRRPQTKASGMVDNERLRTRLKMLDDLARAGWYAHQHSHLLERARQKLEPFSMPAANNVSSTSVVARLGIGLPGVGTKAEVSVGAAITHKHELFSVDTGEVGAGHSHAFTLDAKAEATLAPPFSVGAGAAVSSMQGSYVFADSAPNFARIQARRKVARARMPMHRGRTAALLRRIGNTLQPSRDRYASAQLRALRWNDALKQYTSTSDVHVDDLLPNDTRPDLQHVHVQTYSASANAHGRAFVVDGALSLGADRTRIHVDVPLDPATTALTPVERRQILEQYRERLRALLPAHPAELPKEGTGSRSTLDSLVALFNQPDNAVTLQQRYDITDSILAEFQRARTLAGHCEAKPHSRQRAEERAQLCDGWNCKDINTLGARMQDALNWLLLSAPDTQGPQRDALEVHVLSALKEIRRLPTDMTHAPEPDSAAIYRRLDQSLDTDHISLSADVTSDFAAAGLSVAGAHAIRKDFSPLRAGRGIVLSVAVRGTVNVISLLSLLKKSAPEAHGIDPGMVSGPISDVIDSLSAHAQMELSLHFHLIELDYQKDKNYPDQARGLRLQMVRFLSGNAARMGLTGSVPVAAGVTVGGGASMESSMTRQVACDYFAPDTISGLLLRYKALSDQTGEPASPWSRLCKDYRRSLEDLHRVWAVEHSPATLEARFLLEKHPDSSTHDPMKAHWAAAVLHPFDPKRMKIVFDHLLAAVRHVQSQSSLISPVYLPALDNTGRPILEPPLVTRL